MGFEPTTPVPQGKRLAGARTRPLCDPSLVFVYNYYSTTLYLAQILFEVEVIGNLSLSLLWDGEFR